MGEYHPYPVRTARSKGNRNIVGPRLRELRLAANPVITLEDMAGKLAARGIQIDRSAIGRIENGRRQVLDYELKAFASALRVEAGDLLR